MKLNSKQISKIYKKVELNNGNAIVMIDVSEDKDMPPDESSSNIYCINNEYKIIWQVKEIKAKRPFDDDMFVYLGKDVNGKIIAGRFSGFTYEVNPETGEAEQTGFRK